MRLKTISFVALTATLAACGGGGGGSTPVAVTPPTPVICTAPQVLQAGVCVTPTPTCTAPQILQNGVCVSVAEPSPIQLKASASSIQLGETVTLTWTSTGVTNCNASGDWVGRLTENGSKQITPLKNGTSQYVITCDSTKTSTVAVTISSNNVTDYNSKDIRSLLSIAGEWVPNNASDPVTNGPIPAASSFYSQITLPNNRNGLVLNGWSYNGWSNTIHYPVSAAIFEQNANGTLSVATNKYLTDPLTNGAGSVIVADFNGDGKQDIFFAGHNESPLIAKSSTAFMSNNSGTFTKIDIGDKLEAHHAILSNISGIPTIFVASFDGDPNPYYQYVNGKFVQTKSIGWTGGLTQQGFNWSSFSANSIAVADFNDDGLTDMVIGDLANGPSYPYVQGKVGMGIYKLSDLYSNTGAPQLLLNPYFNEKPEYANIVSLIGAGQTHTYRVWTDDFNKDGKIDILAGGSLWSAANNSQNYNMLQMFQNSTSNGTMSFTDRTDTLNAGFNIISQEMDYSMQFLDIDNSGINTYMSAGSLWVPNGSNNQPENSKQTNYILLNDGTGKLYTYMHNQFQNLGNQVNAFLGISTTSQPRFIEYLTPNKKINLVAEISGSTTLNGKQVSVHKFVNLPLQLDPYIDYKDNVVIKDRNGSKMIRTWAGDDTIAGGCSSTCNVDGGLGLNTITYSGTRSNYSITISPTGFVVKDNTGVDGTDNIKNIQLLKFSNATVDLRTGQF